MTQEEKKAVQEFLDDTKAMAHRALARAANDAGPNGMFNERKLAIARTHLDTCFAVMRDALADIPLASD